MAILRAPFPWFGGKSRVAGIVWRAFGDVPNYVEPFFGSGAVLLGRPHQPGIETVNDKDGYVANFWRAVSHDPEGVAHYADCPVNENDLHARHIWLVNQKADFVPRLEADPDFYDVKIAGWWVWGICVWIGGEWCSGKGPWHIKDGKLVNEKQDGHGVQRRRLHLGDQRRGVNRKRPHLTCKGRGVHASVFSDDGVCANRTENLIRYFEILSDRLRNVRVCCGDWKRVIGPTPTTSNGLTAVFLDPPYSLSDRDPKIYTEENLTVAQDVFQWCKENWDNPMLRIALCGYEGEHDIPEGWAEYRWETGGGYAQQRKKQTPNLNRFKERIWFSPACLNLDGITGANKQQLPFFEDDVA